MRGTDHWRSSCSVTSRTLQHRSRSQPSAHSSCPAESILLRAQGNAAYVAEIPFAFGMDDAVFPAGTYQLTPLSQKMLRLNLVGGTRMGYLMVFPADDASNVATGRLKFTRYGDLYFLRQFSAPKEGREWEAVSRCVPSTNEKRVAKEWMAHAHAPRGVDVAVNSADQH
jgi:hypothetical protein